MADQVNRRGSSAGGRRSHPADGAAILLVALALDLLLGEPPAGLHPVVWLGAAIDRLEAHAPEPESRASYLYGGASALGLVVCSWAAAAACARTAAHLPRAARILTLAMLLKPSFSLRMLLSAGRQVRRLLERGDLSGARRALASLVSRDREQLSAEECAAAAVESLAENLTDSVVGPWLAYTLFGIAGAWAFRAANTLDSRWGYRGRYDRLGRCAAVLDDLLARVPARLSAILLIVGAPAGNGSPVHGGRVLLRDRKLTASPNAGWTIGAIAGALDRCLSKRGHYAVNAEAPSCSSIDLIRAERIVATAATIAAGGVAAIVLCSQRLGSLRALMD